MAAEDKPAAGGHRQAGSSHYTQANRSTDLIRALRWRVWPPDEAAALARRRTHAELRRRHLDVACGLYGRDRAGCRWHVDRMVSLRGAT